MCVSSKNRAVFVCPLFFSCLTKQEMILLVQEQGGNSQMIKKAEKEFIFEKDSVTAACHASTVLPLGDGKVLAAWFGGKREGDDSVGIFLSVRGTDGKWSAPVLVSEDVPVPHWNPVLYEKQNGEIVLFYKYGSEIPDWTTRYVILSRSGEVISKPRELVPGDVSGGRGPVKNKCLRLPDGRLLAPASTEQNKKWIPFVDISDNDGTTWYNSGYMERPKYKGAYVGLIQPSLWRSKDGGVHCFMRSDKGAIYRSSSFDDGISWLKPYRTRLPNNNSGIDCDTDSLGRIWLIYNPVDVNWGVRYPLSLAVSTDNGKHFTEIMKLEAGRGEFSYPAVVCRNDTLYITYTHKRKQVVFWRIELEKE